jgi:hypothetical protein
MNKKSTFFEEVASHNLERFHSQCIAWCMRYSKTEFCIPFIEKVIERKCTNLDKEKIIVDAEVNNCDIKIEFEMNCEKYMIFIENKIKSSESRKPITDELLENLINNRAVRKFNYLSPQEKLNKYCVAFIS